MASCSGHKSGAIMRNKVLLVDDDDKLRNLVTEYLEGFGFQVIALPDGREVLQALETESPDIVILDIMLPGQDGLDILRAIRLKFEVPVIMLTAKGDDADRIVGLELGADDYIPKPFNPRELLARMKAVTRRLVLQEKIGVSKTASISDEGMHRQLKAILSADVKGYSRLMSEDEMSTIARLKNCRELISAQVERHTGRVVDSPGDNILAEFGSVVNAVECAIATQKELRNRNAAIPDYRKMEYRIGINLGDVIVEKERIYGDGVNIAARLEGLAEAGGVCISGTVYDQIESKLLFAYEFLGEKEIKNIRKPVRVYNIKLNS